VTNDSRFILTLDAYDEEHGEPGGLRRQEEVNPPNSVFVEDDRTASTRFFDRFRLALLRHARVPKVLLRENAARHQGIR
jgi:hypothetical protein